MATDKTEEKRFPPVLQTRELLSAPLLLTSPHMKITIVYGPPDGGREQCVRELAKRRGTVTTTHLMPFISESGFNGLGIPLLSIDSQNIISALRYVENVKDHYFDVFFQSDTHPRNWFVSGPQPWSMKVRENESQRYKQMLSNVSDFVSGLQPWSMEVREKESQRYKQMLSNVSELHFCKNVSSASTIVDPLDIKYWDLRAEVYILMNAAERKRAIISGEFNLRKEGNSYIALRMASIQKDLDFVKFLFEMGANVNDKTTNGLTPIYVWSQTTIEILHEFLNQGAQIVFSDDTGTTPLHNIVRKNGQPSDVEIIRMLRCIIWKRNGGWCLFVKNTNGKTPRDCAYELRFTIGNHTHGFGIITWLQAQVNNYCFTIIIFLSFFSLTGTEISKRTL